MKLIWTSNTIWLDRISGIIVKKAPLYKKAPPCLSRIGNKGGFLINSAGLKLAKGGPFAKCILQICKGGTLCKMHFRTENLQRGDPLQNVLLKLCKGGTLCKNLDFRTENLQRGDPLQNAFLKLCKGGTLCKNMVQNTKFAKGGPFAKIWILAQIEFIRKPPPCLSRIGNKGGAFLIIIPLIGARKKTQKALI